MERRLAQANGRLKAAKVGVKIEAIGPRLYLRAVFPPRPNSTKTYAFQQWLSLEYHVNPAGLKLAEQEARKVGALLDCGEFLWGSHLSLDVSLSAQQMGHSVKVHTEIYHAWISDEVHQRAYEALINRPNRPSLPQL